MTAHLRDISATLRAIAAGEIEINDSQARAVAKAAAELCDALANAPDPRLLTDRDVAELPYAIWHSQVRTAALNEALALGGSPQETPPTLEELNAEARRNFRAARGLYDALGE